LQERGRSSCPALLALRDGDESMHCRLCLLFFPLNTLSRILSKLIEILFEMWNESKQKAQAWPSKRDSGGRRLRQ
jgi:hypothetical protein